MRVESVVFHGITFRRYPDSKRWSDGNYYRPHAGHIRRGIGAYHVEVWKEHNGKVPSGCVVHHKDGDTSNNAIENLELLSGHDHLSFHGKKKFAEHRDSFLKHLESIRPLTKEWHASPEGHVWHVQHGIDCFSQREQKERICENCGKKYETVISGKGSRFCSNNCKSDSRRKSGMDNIAKICSFCGGSYCSSKYSQSKFCSRECSCSARKKNGIRHKD